MLRFTRMLIILIKSFCVDKHFIDEITISILGEITSHTITIQNFSLGSRGRSRIEEREWHGGGGGRGVGRWGLIIVSKDFKSSTFFPFGALKGGPPNLNSPIPIPNLSLDTTI